MSKFARNIIPTIGTGNVVDTEHWHHKVNTHHWFRELLKLWRPAGVPSDKDDTGNTSSLRVAVRNGYLSFYCEGQLAAKVKCTAKSFHEKVNRKYLGSDAVGDKDYQILSPPTADEAYGKLAERLQKMATYQGSEKIFIDEVISRNPNIFDIELALSHLKPDATRRVALRLDVASLEPDGDGWKIALWEAKMANNTGASSRAIPKTRAQHQNYSSWLNSDENEADFIAAARTTCASLIGLRELAIFAGNTDMPALGEGIVAVGSKANILLKLDKNVRYLIDGRVDGGSSFTGNGHDQKLREFSNCVVVFKKGDELDISKQ